MHTHNAKFSALRNRRTLSEKNKEICRGCFGPQICLITLKRRVPVHEAGYQGDEVSHQGTCLNNSNGWARLDYLRQLGK